MSEAKVVASEGQAMFYGFCGDYSFRNAPYDQVGDLREPGAQSLAIIVILRSYAEYIHYVGVIIVFSSDMVDFEHLD